MAFSPTSLVDILQWRSVNQPERLAFRFLKDGEGEEELLSYRELDERAKSVAALLQASVNRGDRALLLFPAGFDFISAYFGCLYAGVIAIPIPPPHPARLQKTMQPTLNIVADAAPTVALMDATLFKAIKASDIVMDQLDGVRLFVTDQDKIRSLVPRWKAPEFSVKDLAFLQYTSGSTTAPKGVMVSHGNLMHNLALIEKAFGVTHESHSVIWLPPYHDMGLIGGILQPVFTGFSATLMPHLMFLQRPVRWLRAISHYKATVSGAPNFAYDLCARKVKPEERSQLDLSHWEIAFDGAEKIYHQTLDQFADYFQSSGFQKTAFAPCYGLAEGTLMVTAVSKGVLPAQLSVDKSALGKNRVVELAVEDNTAEILVSSGLGLSDQEVRIVNPESLENCAPDEVGEVWVKGESIAWGYWRKATETKAAFGAFTSDGAGPFLRTGDLGFTYDDELYITGRLKNLLIIDGKNHYPQDIERTVAEAHEAILPAGAAVFPLEQADMEKVVVLAEVHRKLESSSAEVKQHILKAVSERHELHAHDIKLMLPGSIPKTTSGKVKHFLCRQQYVSGSLKEIDQL
ncbi:MAG: fatty acyl-AMP ligase [Roseivirga sp.]